MIEEALELGKNPKLDNGDQSVINTYFKGRIGHLDQHYNYQVGFDLELENPILAKRLAIHNAIHHPKIVHYLGRRKPWQYQSICRLRDLWWKYYALTWEILWKEKSFLSRLTILVILTGPFLPILLTKILTTLRN